MALLTRTSLRINRYWSMADFSFLNMAAVFHLGFLKVGNLTSGPIRRPNMRHRTKFRDKRQTLSVRWPIFDFSRWRQPHGFHQAYTSVTILLTGILQPREGHFLSP